MSWSELSKLYQEVCTQKANSSENNNEADRTVELFCLPPMPEAYFWIWMSSENKIKKQKIETLIADIKSIVLGTPETVCEKLLKKAIDRGNTMNLKAITDIVIKQPSPPAFMQPIIADLLCKKNNSSSINFDGRASLEKLVTKEELQSKIQPEEFTYLTTKAQSEKTLTAEEHEKFSNFVQALQPEKLLRVTLKNPTAHALLTQNKPYKTVVKNMITGLKSEEQIDKVLDSAELFLSLCPNTAIDFLDKKLFYLNKKSIKQEIEGMKKALAWIEDNLASSADKEAWIEEQTIKNNNIKQNKVCISFLEKKLSKLKAAVESQRTKKSSCR